MTKRRAASFGIAARLFLCAGVASAVVSVAAAQDDTPGALREKIHFLIPGGAGGGWDSTARGVGEALSRSGLVKSVSYENISGGSGTKAIAHLVETARRQKDTLMISSSPIVVNAVRKIFSQSYHDLTPVASVIVDYGALVVRADSPYHSWAQVLADFKKDPRRVKVAGGSAHGSMDHLVAALAFMESGADPKLLRYIPYNAGAHAMVGLLSGETQLLSTGLSEVIALSRQGEVRILASTAPRRTALAADVPTLTEQGAPAVFANWRGFFAAPGASEARVREFIQPLAALYQTPQWETIRDNYGWTDFYVRGAEFSDFLREQEQTLAVLMERLGLIAPAAQ